MLISENPAQSVSSSSCLSTFEVKYDDNTYAIQKLHEYDDYELLPRWKRWLARLSPLTTFLAVGSYYLYFPYRIYCTRISASMYNKTYVMAWFFIVAEALVARRSSDFSCCIPTKPSNNSPSSLPPSLAYPCRSRSKPAKVASARPIRTHYRRVDYLLQ